MPSFNLLTSSVLKHTVAHLELSTNLIKGIILNYALVIKIKSLACILT